MAPPFLEYIFFLIFKKWRRFINAKKKCSERLFPNVHTILRLLSITPVTSGTVERSNSSLHFVKNVYRSTMAEDRLNALLLLFIHKDISLDYSAIVNIFASRNQRRMHFINPLDDWNSWFYPDIVFKEHNFCLRNSKKRSSKCWKSHLWRSQFQNCATIPISVTGPLFLNILDPPLVIAFAKGSDDDSTWIWDHKMLN